MFFKVKSSLFPSKPIKHDQYSIYVKQWIYSCCNYFYQSETKKCKFKKCLKIIISQIFCQIVIILFQNVSLFN